ncbi:MAG: hypothetical protein KJZ75_14670 [Hyphomonadaceae bacterium]|nr:hypothetical protein [Hyphomonadaceae bacterium]
MIAALLDLARTHAPLLSLSTLVIGAALAIAGAGPRLSWFIALAAALASAAFASDMALRLLTDGEIVLTIEGAALFPDGVGAFAGALLAGVAVLAVMAAGASLGDYERRAAPFALALLLLTAAGWIGALMARDLVGVLIAVETAWLASVGLVAMSAQRAALNGALRMLGAGGVGGAMFVLGAGLLHHGAGALDLPAIAAAHVERADAAALGAGLVLLGVALKAGVAPLHEWMGAVLGRVNAVGALAVGVLCAIGAIAVIVRLAAYLLPSLAFGEGVSIALAVLGGASVVIGSVQAVGSHNLRRMTGYAGIAQAGGVLLCVALASPAGYAAALVQLTAFAGAALALFGGAAAGGVQTLETLDGLGRRAPLAGAAIMAGAVSLMGAPLTLGFLGRWRLVEAGVGAGWWWAAGAVIFASLAGVFYGGRLIERLYFRRAGEVYAGARDVWRWAMAPMLAASIVVIGLGVAPAGLLAAADAAAAHIAGSVR